MKLKQLCLTRSNKLILNNLTVELPGTGVTVLLGANGAGKSSLLNVVAGISELSSGHLQLEKNTVVSLMPEPAVFYPQLTVQEQLAFVATLYEVDQVDESVSLAIETWQLAEVKHVLTKHLSLGYRQRLSLAQLSVSHADLWLMDEPMNGMDPDVLAVFKTQIKAHKQTKAIIMATHIMHEAQELADWVVVMHQGQAIHSAAYDQQTQFYELYQQTIKEHQHKYTQTSDVVST